MNLRVVVAVAGIGVAVAAGAASGAQAGVSGHRVGARATNASSWELAYVRGTDTPQVWAAKSGGAGHKLGAGQQPLVSPNGAYVAVASDIGSGKTKTLVYLTSTGKSISFAASSSSYSTPLAWSRDSRYLALSVTSNSTTSTSGDSLVIVDMSTLTAKVIVHGVVDAASFAPAGVGKPADVLVYDKHFAAPFSPRANLFETAASGGAVKQLTSDGLSLNPVWGRRGVVFDRERLRGKYGFPAYQLWLLSGSKARQLTHMKIGSLVSGLVPIAVSASGNRLIASYEGEDTDYAWRVQLSPLVVKAVAGYVQAGGISRDGQKLLVDVGAFEQPPNDGTVEWLPFGGGKAHKLARGADPSWNL